LGTQDCCISTVRTTDGVIVVEASGEIDIKTSLAFKERLFGILDEGAAQVVVDLSSAGHVDTTGLSVLWESAKRCGREDRKFSIVCSGGRVRHALATSGLDQFVATHATLDEAIGRDSLSQ
jgi:anti-sigma B factor antagonist